MTFPRNLLNMCMPSSKRVSAGFIGKVKLVEMHQSEHICRFSRKLQWYSALSGNFTHLNGALQTIHIEILAEGID